MKRPKICVVGSSNYDVTTFVPRLPSLGETLRGSRLHLCFGGKGANQAVMAARLGADVSMISKLGIDIFGEATLSNFKSEGIDTAHVTTTSEALSGLAAIAVGKDGGNSIILVAGANDLLSTDDVTRARDSIESADALLCQLEVPLETTIRALEIAGAANTLRVFNPAPAPNHLDPAIYEHCDIICPNESEAELLTGAPVQSIEQALEAASTLRARGPRIVVVTLGQQGCVAAIGGDIRHYEAKKVSAVDTTGAGDSFIATLSYFLAAGADEETAIERAMTVAARSVETVGTQSSFPRREDLGASFF